MPNFEKLGFEVGPFYWLKPSIFQPPGVVNRLKTYLRPRKPAKEKQRGVKLNSNNLLKLMLNMIKYEFKSIPYGSNTSTYEV